VNITRRSLINGLAATMSMVTPVGARAFALPSEALFICDSRFAASRALRARHAGPSIDLEHEREHRWQRLRGLRGRGPIVGLTGWTDLVQVRAALEPGGLRVRVEARRGPLYYWEMG
jgi:hypothetical protein